MGEAEFERAQFDVGAVARPACANEAVVVGADAATVADGIARLEQGLADPAANQGEAEALAIVESKPRLGREAVGILERPGHGRGSRSGIG